MASSRLGESPAEYAKRILKLYPTTSNEKLRSDMYSKFINVIAHEIDKAIYDARSVLDIAP